MTENHRQLARIGMFGPVMANAQPPSILGVRVAVGARTQVWTGRIAPHVGATRQHRQARAKETVGESHPPATVHVGWIPFQLRSKMPGASLPHGGEDSSEPALHWERQQRHEGCSSWVIKLADGRKGTAGQIGKNRESISGTLMHAGVSR